MAKENTLLIRDAVWATSVDNQYLIQTWNAVKCLCKIYKLNKEWATLFSALIQELSQSKDHGGCGKLSSESSLGLKKNTFSKFL